ncbi:hypothetical protein ACFFMR_19030 [Micromonospora andamanensis]|uniref:Uncharacterized protein n=1 Tax=Micromonospora andamanensis TaxID=1287068 RepID=A0ABQ4HYQ7_9ACTN|nr:hypothetical protein [Micromonospora andamanensis]GIJ10762.1 hypothetical protein Van01_39760 [Micromonospora andamanensis]
MSIASILRGHTSEQYIGRHRRETVQPAAADWSPLHPADRAALAPTYWADRHLPAGPDERTAHHDLAAIERVRAAAQGQPVTWGEVMAELRDQLDQTAPTEQLPAVTGEQPDPAETAVDQIFTDVMTTEHTR